MLFKSRLTDSLKKDGGKKWTAHAKRAYESFFQGYTEYEVQSKPRKTVRVYTGSYYMQKLNGRIRVLVKLYYCMVFALLCAAIWFLGGLSSVKSTKYSEFLYAVAVFLLGWLLIALVHYVPSGRHMTVYRYTNAVNHLRKASLGLACVFVLLVGVSTVEMISSGAFRELYFAMQLLCAALAASVYWMERHIIYVQIENTTATAGIACQGTCEATKERM